MTYLILKINQSKLDKKIFFITKGKIKDKSNDNKGQFGISDGPVTLKAKAQISRFTFLNSPYT